MGEAAFLGENMYEYSQIIVNIDIQRKKYMCSQKNMSRNREIDLPRGHGAPRAELPDLVAVQSLKK